MAEFPAMLLWTDAWIADTKHLTRCERGTYLDLLILMWRLPSQRLPNDDLWLAKRMSMSVKEVEIELRPLIAEFCRNDGNWITQKRLNAEYQWVKQKRSRRSEAAKARWRKEKALYNADAPIPIPTPIEDKKEESPPVRGSPKPRAAKIALVLDDDFRTWIAENAPAIDGDAELAAHLDWKLASGRKYRDDRAGFRTWCRRAQKDADASRSRKGANGHDKRSPVEKLYAGAAIALARRAAQREADSRTDLDPDEPLLDK